MHKKHNLTWTVGHSNSHEIKPKATVPATVPGAVQLDWAAAHNWPPHYYSDNFKMFTWMEDVYWTYSATINTPSPAHGQQIFLACKGVDYEYIVRLNGEIIYEWEGMFTPFELD
ncbi:MAG: hypothetical protein FWC77_03265, partial [Defluviitaleaceae bacterium]|nr:hypothetical protein [Defluviitaleaceae bacterium]